MSALDEFNESQISRRAPPVTGVACAGCKGAMWRVEGRPGVGQTAIAYCTGLHKDMYDHRKAVEARIAFEDWKDKKVGAEKPEAALYSWPVICDGTHLAAEAADPGDPD